MKHSIKRRWAKNILASIIAVLLVCSAIILYTVYNRYHNTVEQNIRARITRSVDTYFLPYSLSDEESFAIAAAEFTDTFLHKDIMEVWVLDRNGKMIVSSSGFSEYEDKVYDDYIEALYSESRIGSSLTMLDSGEHVTAVTYILRDENDNVYGALRYMISMRDIDAQFAVFTMLVIVVMILVILLFSMSGGYFISSIVNPLQKINQITKEIANGNFDVKIESEKDDEIGELATSITDMADRLSRIDEMKNDFISTVSHEIRTPLTAIKGWGETLINIDGDTELQKKGLGVIVEETARLSVMVEDLLNFSRIQNGGMTVLKEKLDIISAVNGACLIYKQKADNEGYDFDLSFRHGKLFVYADSDKIRQVLVNILDNAFKYTAPGGKINVLVEKVKKGVRITVADTGCGIESKDIAHVKEKFFKANNTVRGTGIGLAVVDEIIKMHNGSFDIYSVHGKGTTVTVELPLYTKESDYE